MYQETGGPHTMAQGANIILAREGLFEPTPRTGTLKEKMADLTTES